METFNHTLCNLTTHTLTTNTLTTHALTTQTPTSVFYVCVRNVWLKLRWFSFGLLAPLLFAAQDV